jgi:multidrug efflux pump subunit AcrA (membrane-fusion protein)
VRVDQRADVYTSAYREPFPGKVTRINPAIDPKNRTFEVEILVPNNEGHLKPGGFAKTAILASVDDLAPTVPLESIVQFAGVTKIFVVVDGRAQEIQVTLGTQATEWVEIASPRLAEGSQVVTSGQTAIASGSSVTIRTPSGASAPALAAQEAAAKSAEPAAPVARKEAVP